MAEKYPRSPAAAPRKGPGPAPGAPRSPGLPAPREADRGAAAPLASFFTDQAPMAARPDEVVDTDAATRVAVDAQIFGGSERPNLMDAGWRQDDPGQATVNLSADVQRLYPQLQRDRAEEQTAILPLPDPQPSGGGWFPDDMKTMAIPTADPVYVVDAQVVDSGQTMPMQGGPQEYGLVPVGSGGGSAQEGDPGYSWLHVNPPEHLGQVAPELVMMTQPESFAAAQFRTLRYRLEQETNTQILVVTSPRAGEGKSVTAANLALALAEGGRIQVLLIDAALRAPTLHTLFGIRGELGLTSVLAARQDNPNLPVDVVGITRSLCLIPAGPPVASAHAALASEAAAVLIGILRREFRYIIVDSAPVFGTAETLAWHGLVDKYILVARQGRTTTEDLTNATARLSRDRILGVSMVGAKTKPK